MGNCFTAGSKAISYSEIATDNITKNTDYFWKELQQLAEQYGIFQPHDQLTWVAQGQNCDIKDYIKAADWILTSPDSTSMVAEVVMSGSKLLVLYDEQSMQDEQIKHQLKF